MNEPDGIFPAAILAGGLATRMRPLTERIPKSLLDINGEPFIAWQLRLMRGRGIRKVVVCAGHLGEMIEEYVGNGAKFGVEVSYSYDGDKLMGTGGAIRRALPKLGETFFVVYGDSYLPCDWRAVGRCFAASGKSGLMTVFCNHDQFDRSNVEYADGRIMKYSKKEVTPAMKHIDYGLGVFHARAFESLPTDRPSDMASLYQSLLAANDLAAFEVDARFYEIGSMSGLNETAQYLTTHAPPCEN